MNTQTVGYIFKKDINNNFEFIGDFESLYKNEDDPWNQSAKDGEISSYHKISRKRLGQKLLEVNPSALLEVGCGLGYTTNQIQQQLPNSNILGADISTTAISRAKKLFTNLNFKQGDICASDFYEKFKNFKPNSIILNQLLWYVLEDLDTCISNCFNLLKKNNFLIFSQGFLKEDQKYGREIIDGYEGLLSYINKDLKKLFKIEFSDIHKSEELTHNDGLLILSKK
jgi:SAM-dependent methyltransferase